jgi:hypothetical protein
LSRIYPEKEEASFRKWPTSGLASNHARLRLKAKSTNVPSYWCIRTGNFPLHAPNRGYRVRLWLMVEAREVLLVALEAIGSRKAAAFLMRKVGNINLSKTPSFVRRR